MKLLFLKLAAQSEKIIGKRPYDWKEVTNMPYPEYRDSYLEPGKWHDEVAKNVRHHRLVGRRLTKELLRKMTVDREAKGALKEIFGDFYRRSPPPIGIFSGQFAFTFEQAQQIRKIVERAGVEKMKEAFQEFSKLSDELIDVAGKQYATHKDVPEVHQTVSIIAANKRFAERVRLDVLKNWGAYSRIPRHSE